VIECLYPYCNNSAVLGGIFCAKHGCKFCGMDCIASDSICFLCTEKAARKAVEKRLETATLIST